MTIKEISQLYYLNNEIKLYKRQLAELESQRGISALNADGMPHAKGMNKSQVERLAADIVDLEAIIHAKQIECIHERNRLTRYINTIQDSMMRQIFMCRFVNGMSWEDVASVVDPSEDGELTSDAVKKRCYRYLEKI